MVNDDYFGECVKRNNAMPIKLGLPENEVFSECFVVIIIIVQ